MSAMNPYEVLKLPRDADIETIEDAYDRLFDKFEPRALAGDTTAIDMLGRLNEARDTLVDPSRRADLDASLGDTSANRGKRKGTASNQKARAEAGIAPRPVVRIRPGTVTRQTPSQPRGQSAALAVKPRRYNLRPRSVQPRPSFAMPVVIVAVLALVGAAILVYLLARGSLGAQAQEPSRGKIVATVNGQPIYDQDYQEQIASDKAVMLSDPLYGPLVNNFQGITGTRMLDVLSSDALDKLINMEVIAQQAQKEGAYPSAAQQAQVIQTSKQNEAINGDFQAFLKQRGITEGQYNRRVISNFVYLAMATAHRPVTGTTEERDNAFIQWICDTRKNYDVKILLTYQVPNKPCTSGLPSNYQLPGTQNQPPEAQPTTQAPITPGADTSPTAQPTQAKP